MSEGTFAGVGGVPIHWETAAPPSGRPRGVVLLAHGYAEHSGRYRELIAHVTARGLALATIDHRGHGRSGGARGHCEDIGEYVADLRTLVDRAGETWPGVPRIMFGHSMGGLLAFLYLLAHPDTVRAGALSAPAFEVADRRVRLLQTVALVVARIAPGTTFRSNLDESALSRDPAVGAAYVADPLVHRAASAGFVRALRAGQAAAMDGASRLRVPLLIVQGEADRIVPPSGSVAIVARLTCTHELVLLPGFYHELLNEPGTERTRVLDLLDRWFDRWLEA